MPEPHQVGTPLKSVSLTGTVFPWDGSQPHYLRMPESNYLYLPCFTDVDKLRDMMDRLHIQRYVIKQVDDGPEFLTSFDVPKAEHVRVILDPHFIGEGKIRFTQAPVGYSLDLGVTDDGQTLLVEVNDAWALGAYGTPSIPFTEMIVNRWKEMVGI